LASDAPSRAIFQKKSKDGHDLFAPYVWAMREIILKHLMGHVDKDLEEAKARMASLKESLDAESKSSAGDKHETGRAMIHLEQERVQETVGRLEHMHGVLVQRATQGKAIQRVSPGALVETTGPWVLVGVPLGKVQLPDALVLCVGVEAPLAQQWHGAQPGDQVVLGSQQLTIEAIH
jgi:hypothetical protein